MSTTSPTAPSYRASHPFGLGIVNEKENSILYIKNLGKTNTWTIEMTNLYNETVSVPYSGTPQASATNYQLGIRFRPGTLEMSSTITDPNGIWTTALEVDAQSGIQTLYLQSKDPLQWEAQQFYSITLDGLIANHTQGARMTKIELFYNALQVGGNTNSLSGSIAQTIQVVSHIGVDEVPVYFGVSAGTSPTGLSTQVLSDGSASNSFQVSIREKDAFLNLNGGTATLVQSTTQLVVTFLEGAATDAFSLLDSSDPGVLSITNVSNGWKATTSNTALNEVTLTPVAGANATLKELSFVVSGLLTNQPYGKTPVRLQYYSLNGVWDGETTFWLDKSPLVTTGSGKVGIGTSTPSEMLEVNGTLKVPYTNINSIQIGDSLVAHSASLFMTMPQGSDHWPMQVMDSNSDNLFCLTSSGQVAIGNITPSEKLVVNGNAKVAGVITAQKGITASGTGSNNSSLSLPYPSAGGTNGVLIGESQTGNPSSQYAGLFISVPDSPVCDPLQINNAQGDCWFSISEQGKVGIGVLNATEALEVQGNAKVDGVVTAQKGLTASGTDSNSSSISLPFPSKSNTNGILIGESQASVGWAGLFISVPSNPVCNVLQVNDASNRELASITGSGVIQAGNGLSASGTGSNNSSISVPFPSAAHTNGILIGDSQTSVGWAGLFISVPSSPVGNPFQVNDASNNELVAINESGRIQANKGMYVSGTNSNANAPFEVHSSRSTTVNSNGGYWMTSQGTHSTGSFTNNLSIWCSEGISAGYFAAYSDARIKDVLGLSNPSQDLAILNRLEITDYHYRDPLKKGPRSTKKLIGQQVAKVYPQAVSLGMGLIPDIMEIAAIADGWVTLPKHTLTEGTVVKLIFSDNTHEELEVLEVKSDLFRVACDRNESVFVYGREVNDFHHVDYEAVSMLNVSATQALYQLVQAQQQEIDALKKAMQMNPKHHAQS